MQCQFCYTHIHTCAYTWMYSNNHMYVCTHTYTHTHTHTHTYTHLDTHSQTSMHTVSFECPENSQPRSRLCEPNIHEMLQIYGNIVHLFKCLTLHTLCITHTHTHKHTYQRLMLDLIDVSLIDIIQSECNEPICCVCKYNVMMYTYVCFK